MLYGIESTLSTRVNTIRPLIGTKLKTKIIFFHLNPNIREYRF